ncbi:hypothetical protein EBU58_03685 [bacterium]|nr:hypothetical protein [bacterium]
MPAPTTSAPTMSSLDRCSAERQRCFWARENCRKPAIAEVVEERGAREQTTVVTFDAQAAAIEYMANGGIDAMVVQNPFEMGVKSVRLLLAMLEGDDDTIGEMFPNPEAADGDVHTTGLRIIVPEEGSVLGSDSFDPAPAERMTLPAFREWLATYGLTSS